MIPKLPYRYKDYAYYTNAAGLGKSAVIDIHYRMRHVSLGPVTDSATGR